MRGSATIAVLATVTGLLVGPGARAGSTQTCLGKTATLVAGAQQHDVEGTVGPDVIVALTGGVHVDALGGDDTICVTDGRVAAGDGNDAVLATTPARHSTYADLGPGDDSFVGGPGADTVDVGVVSSSPGGDASAGADVILTGGGRDQVRSGGFTDSNGAPVEPNRDRVDLGNGTNSINLSLPPGSDADISGVLGSKSSLQFQSVGGDFTFDLANGQVMRDGLTVARIGSFRSLQLDLAGQGSVHLLGTAHRDVVQTFAAQVSANLAAGRDILNVLFPSDIASKNEIDGGPGRDSLGINTESTALTADLEAGWLLLDKPGTSIQFAMSGVENIGAHVARAHIHGDGHRNVLVTTGCPARIDGAGGRDVLVYNRDGNCGAVLTGGPGRDRLIGGIGNDRLIGGRGNDFANGWTGSADVCRVEVEKNCDR